jgi:hypothetical protein
MLRDIEVTPFEMFAITSYQNFFNQIFPARTGELTLIYYLKKVGGASLSRGSPHPGGHAHLRSHIVAVFFLGRCSFLRRRDTAGSPGHRRRRPCRLLVSPST